MKWDAVPGFWTSIGDATLKYHAWGDGYERSRMLDHGDSFTVWYESANAVVGVLTYNADDDYDLGERLIAEGRPTHPVADELTTAKPPVRRAIFRAMWMAYVRARSTRSDSGARTACGGYGTRS